jgi:hypothetical protein
MVQGFYSGVQFLEKYTINDLPPLIVCLTGEDIVTERLETWIKKQNHPLLHISSKAEIGRQKLSDFTLIKIKEYCQKVLAMANNRFSKEEIRAGKTALENWKKNTRKTTETGKYGHNILTPNHMALIRAGYSIEPTQPFLGHNESEYSRIIIQSAEEILNVRKEFGFWRFYSYLPPKSAILLVEPALYRQDYASKKPKGLYSNRAAIKTLKMIQKQKGLFSEAEETFIDELRNSPEAQALLIMRQTELATFTLGIGVYASQTCSSVIRLGPGVNHVFRLLSDYARCIRSGKNSSRVKAKRLFQEVQDALTRYIGPEKISFLEKHNEPIKIIADAPIEWLSIRGLPLCLQRDCSRINATPGNLLMGQLAKQQSAIVSLEGLKKILIVTTFEDKDPLKDMLKASIQALQPDFKENIELDFKTAQNSEEFVSILNAFDGNILIFDGHGADNAKSPIGKLLIGQELIDIWEHSNKVRIPPIVILSACDTHSLDASSQATVGNGFLALGAQTVLATFLPVDGRASAALIARLIFRISVFIPAALSARKQSITWTEVVSGMLRMTLATEIIHELIGLSQGSSSPQGKIQVKANMDINYYGGDIWYDNLISNISRHLNQPKEVISGKAEEIVSRSEAIRYLQLGHPENILITSQEIIDSVMPETNSKS